MVSKLPAKALLKAQAHRLLIVFPVLFGFWNNLGLNSDYFSLGRTFTGKYIVKIKKYSKKYIVILYLLCYIITMYRIRFTKSYRLWYSNLADIRAKARIDIRLNSVKKGTFGVQRSVGNGIFELKIDYGQGYRIYYKKVHDTLIVLLCGGDKSTQDEDVVNAKKILKELEDGNI